MNNKSKIKLISYFIFLGISYIFGNEMNSEVELQFFLDYKANNTIESKKIEIQQKKLGEVLRTIFEKEKINYFFFSEPEIIITCSIEYTNVQEILSILLPITRYDFFLSKDSKYFILGKKNNKIKQFCSWPEATNLGRRGFKDVSPEELSIMIEELFGVKNGFGFMKDLEEYSFVFNGDLLNEQLSKINVGSYYVRIVDFKDWLDNKIIKKNILDLKNDKEK